MKGNKMKLIERSRRSGSRSVRFRMWVWFLIASCCQLTDVLISLLTVGKYRGNFGVWWCFYSELSERLEDTNG